MLLLSSSACEENVAPDVDAARSDAGVPLDAPARDDASDDPDARTLACTPGAVETCYEGPSGTRDVGACVAGTHTCAIDGSGFGACTGQTLPRAEDCATAIDDDCDGTVNESEAGCVCTPGTSTSCYGGPAGSAGVGICVAGTRACAADGRSYVDACVGEVRPSSETCANDADDDCDGAVNEEGEGCACQPGTTRACYAGPAGTEGVAACAAGEQACLSDGTGYGDCVGDVLPEPETCANAVDDDCDGAINEDGDGCACAPGSTSGCYTGPPGTQGVGVCSAGTQTCDALGTAYGACVGETLPAPSETCGDGVDDDCDGTPDDGCAVRYATIQGMLESLCGPCHTTGSASALNVRDYASTQIAAGSCAGMTQGACMLVRIQNGTMPRGGVCTGDPTLDVGRPACLDADDHAALQAWITGGQLP
ncbi:MopE-related protein [Sandaracinus amylolyticus]|uniref:MopE-related protein n=1 Tax=Sandaracinus amylolyticus TaxID=927083 RepID=UPI00146FD8E5|nr:MopE-related protein [Sandaracinus amylolyticus]